MNSFYTSVNRYGNSILYRGYNQAGNRIEKRIKFEPTLFIKTSEKTEYKTLDGVNVRPIKFESMRAAREYADQYKEIDNFEIYGMQNYIYQFITDRFPKQISYDQRLINVNIIDIEVESAVKKYDPKYRIKVRKKALV